MKSSRSKNLLAKVLEVSAGVIRSSGGHVTTRIIRSALEMKIRKCEMQIRECNELAEHAKICSMACLDAYTTSIEAGIHPTHGSLYLAGSVLCESVEHTAERESERAEALMRQCRSVISMAGGSYESDESSGPRVHAV